MKFKSILLVCGTGASSGFMAKNLRVAAKSKGYEISVKARGDAEVEDYVEEIDLLLVGPHLKYMLKDLEEITNPYNVPVKIIPDAAYGSLDGDAVIEFIETL
ncbi:MAG: PTS sugar transporter subunit IIB [Anaerorhabdus sp.]|jgi:cellobiose PTS system EIIB component